jgi:hypothetical protein
VASTGFLGPSPAGVASGAFNASRQVGAAIGVALFGTLVSGGHALIGQALPDVPLRRRAALLAIPATKALHAGRQRR